VHSFATKSLFVAKLHLCFEFQASARKIFGFKSLQTNQWPDQEAWKSQGVIAYKEAKDASGARHVMLTFRTRLTRCSVQKRLAFLHVRFEAMVRLRHPQCSSQQPHREGHPRQCAGAVAREASSPCSPAAAPTHEESAQDASWLLAVRQRRSGGGSERV